MLPSGNDAAVAIAQHFGALYEPFKQLVSSSNSAQNDGLTTSVVVPEELVEDSETTPVLKEEDEEWESLVPHMNLDDIEKVMTKGRD